MTDLAFKACYSDWKLIKTRGVVQVVMEVPLAEADAAYKVLGGMPDVSREQWFGVAALKLAQAEKAPSLAEPSEKAKREWRSVPVSQQAGIRINEPTFAAYLREEHPVEWHETGEADACLKFICKIGSKRDIAHNHKALTLWRQIDTDYQGWLAKERVGA